MPVLQPPYDQDKVIRDAVGQVRTWGLADKASGKIGLRVDTTRGPDDLEVTGWPLPGGFSSGRSYGYIGALVDPPNVTTAFIKTSPYCEMEYSLYAVNATAFAGGRIGLKVLEFELDPQFRVISTPVDSWLTLWRRQEWNGMASFRQQNDVLLRDSFPVTPGRLYLIFIQAGVEARARHDEGNGRYSSAVSDLDCQVSAIKVDYA